MLLWLNLKSKTFEHTNWDKILNWYLKLYQMQPMPSHVLTMAVICIQNKDYKNAELHFKNLKPETLEQRIYLYYAAKADYYYVINDIKKALEFINKALQSVTK